MSASLTSTRLQRPPTVIRPTTGWVPPRLDELWDNRELLYFFAWRDLKVRYAQTLLGAVWTIFQPLALILVFSLAFRKLGKIQTEDLPYPVFAFAGLVFWTFFSRAVARGADSLVANSGLLTKVSIPRLLLPVSAITSGFVDFLIGFCVYVVMAALYGVYPTWRMLLLPAILVLGLTYALAMILVLSATNVRYRDVGQALPFLMQLWLFLSPIAYPLTTLGSPWTTILALNPLVGIVESFRWSVAASAAPPLLHVAISIAVSLAVLGAGLAYFARVERTFADVI